MESLELFVVRLDDHRAEADLYMSKTRLYRALLIAGTVTGLGRPGEIYLVLQNTVLVINRKMSSLVS